MKQLYELYTTFMWEKHPGKVKIKASYYGHIFRIDFNIAAPVRTDTCCTCDSLHGKLEANKGIPEKERIVDDIKKKMAKAGQEIITHFRIGPYNNPSVRPLCFDLQQTFPTQNYRPALHITKGICG